MNCTGENIHNTKSDLNNTDEVFSTDSAGEKRLQCFRKGNNTQSTKDKKLAKAIEEKIVDKGYSQKQQLKQCPQWGNG